MNTVRDKFISIYFCASFMAIAAFAVRPTDQISLRVEPAAFSPNGDGVEDDTFISPVLISGEPVVRWRLDISSDRREITRLSGSGFSALIKWDGRDRKGAFVPDGNYSVQMTVWGRHGKIVSAPQRVTVDRKAPQLSIACSTRVVTASVLHGEMLYLKPRAQDESPLDRWQIQVMNERGQTVKVFWSSGPVQDVAWNCSDENTNVLVPRGRYSCVFQAWDKAGNESAPVVTDFSVDVEARQMLQGALQHIHVFETPEGLLVQLVEADIIQSHRGKQHINPAARPLLDEVALLINAYPGAPVSLDGYSFSKKKADFDRRHSSFESWLVYSYLIKKGRVAPARLTVHGRGRSPMFERRAYAPAPVKNGVEVLLSGPGPW